jgi:hypothetical protein
MPDATDLSHLACDSIQRFDQNESAGRMEQVAQHSDRNDKGLID